MGKKSFNLEKIAFPAFAATALGVTFSALILPDILSIDNDEARKDITIAATDNIEYELISPDVVRVKEKGADLTHDFHFSSGHIFVERDGELDNTTFTMKFEDIVRPEWIDEVKAKGCELAQKTLDYPQDPDVKPTNFEEALANAQQFHTIHCLNMEAL